MMRKAIPGTFLTDIAVRSDDVAAVIASRCGDSSLHTDAFVSEWIIEARKNASLNSMLVSLDAVDGWKRDPATGSIRHTTGRFFSIIGIHCRHRIDQTEIEWDQPIIEQPETGILGILVKSINGILHFCLQAKEEPGNIGGIQLSPTLQATYSNYTGAHGGSRPLFLEHFMPTDPERVIFARMQTEDGGRFLYKSNRNMIVSVGEDCPDELPVSFIWLTMRQIAGLMESEYLVNACTRSILSSLIFSVAQVIGAKSCGEKIRKHSVVHDPEETRATFQWFDDRKAANHIQARRIGLNDLDEWKVDGKGFFSHRENRFFRIVGLKVSSGTRETKGWGQPIIENMAPGIIGLLVRNGSNGIEFLMQAKAEAGNRSTVQLGPTVQFTQGNYEGSRKLNKPFLYNDFIEHDHFSLIHESRQTEEGARFYREYHLHRILMLPDDTELSLPPDYRWMSLEHVIFMLHLGEKVNSCARSILSCLL